jgi:formate dehydrogenase assembly factor FdhD
MPYCPTCKKVVNDASECPTCGSTVVDELPFQVIQGDNTTWVEIVSTGTADEANLIRGFLEAEGIPAQIENVKFNAVTATFGNMGDIRVYVSAQDEARALELLRQREKEWDKLEDDDDTLVTDEGVAEIDENASTEPE